MTLRLKDIKTKGIKNMMVQQEDKLLTNTLQQQMTSRKTYLKSIVPMLVRKTRDNNRVGNLQSRLERGRAYLDRLEHNFDKQFVFRPPKKEE